MDVDALVRPGRRQLFVGGEWRDSLDDSRFPVVDPATGRAIADVADATPEDALAALAKAEAARPSWAETPPRRRAEILRRAFEATIARTDALAELMVRESGKTLADARGEVAYAAEFLRWFSEEAVRLDGSVATAPGGAHRIVVVRKPVGTALLVTPWNFPAAMITRKVAPALAAGCCVVLKPASETPLTALALAGILHEAGVPAGVLAVLPTTRDAALVEAALGDPRVHKLSFTGSTEVGRRLLARAATRVVRCSMELGGNAPFVVFADADLDAAVAGFLVAKMRNNAQACTSANRVLVEEPVVEEFTRRIVRAMGTMRVGPGLDPGTQLGPLVDAAGRDKVDRLVGAAVRAGARVLCGGAVPEGPGFFYPPTVLADVAPDSPILREEVFGPVAPVVAFRDEAEAIRLANDTEHGLVAYVWSRDLARALRVAEAIEAGMVGVNRGLVSDPAAPFGGVKQSGLGREGGHEGLLEYTEQRYLAVEW